MTAPDEQDSELLYSFGTLNPSLARFDHVISETGVESFEVVRRVVKVNGGIWNHAPYFWPHPPDYFRLWREPTAEESLQHYLQGGGNSVRFTMVIPLDTPQEVLERLDAIRPPGYDRALFPYYLEAVAAHVPALGWAYIPLADESSWSIFVAAGPWAWAPPVVLDGLRAEGLAAFALRCDESRCYWEEPVAPPSS